MAYRSTHRMLLPWLICLALCLQLGCDQQAGQSGDASAFNDGDNGPTIVSLTPAITQMLLDMGKRDQIVGIAEYDNPDLELPVCGSYNNPVLARIIELGPDLVLTQSSTGRLEDAHEGLRDYAEKDVFELKVIPYSRSLADVHRALIDPASGLGVAVDDLEAAQRARDLMQLRIERISAIVTGAERPRVLMLINPTTLGAIGTGVTHDELLRLAGGANALAHVNTGYLTLDRAMLQQTIRPEVVLILEPRGSELTDSDPRLRPFEGLAIPVNTSRRFAVIRHPQAMLPSTALPEVMKEIALALHPDKAEAIREAYDTAGLVVKQAAEDGDGK
ncbi:MAG: ABC transporter substrate-binding protein [Planctomycetota bacterium]